jgi:signal transduction histidine kinase/ligand-binding sensor domain-containing protein
MSRIKPGLALLTLGALEALVWPPAAFALDPSLDVRQYAHNAWSFRDASLNGAVYAFAQTPDGYLWMGTASGVIRYDGVRLTPLRLPHGQRLPSTAVWNLLAAHDGTLWIGTLDGLASWKDGRLTTYPALAGYFIDAILEDRQGTVWAGAFDPVTAKLCAIRNGNTNCYGSDGGIAVTALYEDADGSLWVGATTGVWQWKPGPRSRWIQQQIQDRQSFAQGDDRSAVIVAMNKVCQIVGNKIMDYPLHGVPSPLTAANVFRDRDGGLWIGTRTQGLVHSYRGKTSIITHNDGLSSDQVFAVFEDREGTIWVSTDNGLDRFRESPVSSLSEWQGLSSAPPTSILAARDGSIWIGTMDGLKRWKDGRMAIYRTRTDPTLPGDAIGSLAEDESGRIWISGIRGLAVFGEGKFKAVPAVPPGDKHAIAADNHGGLWLSLWLTSKGDGLAHLVGGRIIEGVSWETVGGGPGSGLVPDPDGGVWTGLITGGIAHYRAGHVERLPSSKQAVDAPRVVNLFRGRDGVIWAATEDGLARIVNRRVAMLTTENGLPCNSVHWIVEDDLSFYWLYTRCGLLRIARTELEGWASDPKRTVQPTSFGSTDGVQVIAIPSASRPAVTKSSDGKIWFLNGHLVSVIDPSHIRINTLPPPVHIEQIAADGRTHDVKPGLRLPSQVRDVSIEYTALSLIAPEKVRFRYKLEGQDPDWKEVVNGRRVQYSNLPPRNYRFRVIASNNSGVWNEAGASLDFSVDPAYYQTSWFRALCVATFLALLWVTYRWRVGQLARDFNLRVEERVNERTRIARELHDTLLQSVQASLVQMQVARMLVFRQPEQAGRTLDRAMETVEGAIAEGRDAIGELRSQSAVHANLAKLLTLTGQELASTQHTEGKQPALFRTAVEGEQRKMKPLIQDEAYRIARELLRNAFQHANASEIEAEIRYEDRAFRLRVRDDGNGIDPKVLRAGGRTGHWGLTGMRERAKRIGGQLEIWSETGAGTEVELSIPSTIAYEAGDGRRPFRLFQRKRVQS